MRQQDYNGARRDSKSFVVVDEDCGVPTSVVEESFRASNDPSALDQYDHRSVLLSMAEYDKPQAYPVYDYNAATRPEQGQDYSGFATHTTFPGQYVGAQAQVPSGLPQSTGALGLAHSTQPYGTHDQEYYGQQQPQFPAYLDTAPRQFPELITFAPNEGPAGTKVTVQFRSLYDLDAPHVTAFIMFGQKRCEGNLTKTQQGQMYHYALSADTPPRDPNSPTVIPLQLVLDSSSVTWDSPSLEFGNFTYLEPTVFYPSTSPAAAPSRKRKLSVDASPRRSPSKKAVSNPQYQQATGGAQGPPYISTNLSASGSTSPFRRPSAPESFPQNRRYSVDYQQSYGASVPRQHYYVPGPGQSTPSVRTTQSPSWGYHPGVHSATRSPSTAPMSASGKNAQLLPSPAGSNPPLIRTSTLQTSPTTPSTAASSAGFNPYTMMAANSKAILKIDGELNSMPDQWSTVEWEAKRRLVQFRRSQSGSVITATFEPVTLEDRIPNSICVSCIYWEEKKECYVTSVDTIQLLESLVAVRFTVEEKNRIRRNLEGFRPATVSKVKADSEEFFKLIMGFPNPKPRNIEKDVKVFPWRILATALKKIIGKYSASYSSTAGALHTGGPASYSTTGRASDVGIDHRTGSPRSASSAVPQAYAPPMMVANAYPSNPTPHGLGPQAMPGAQDMRLQYHPSSALVGAGPGAPQWQNQQQSNQAAYYAQMDNYHTGYNNYPGAGGSPATGLPGAAQAYHYSQRYPATSHPAAMPGNDARYAPLHDYDEPSQQTSAS